jgi:hypothetical protein
MKRIASMTLTLSLGVAGMYAQQRPVNGSFLGISVPSAVILVPGAFNSEYNFAGNSPVGRFVFRTLSASVPSTAPANASCPGGYGAAVVGSGVFRFEDGSLLLVNLTGGTDCITLVPQPEAHCVRNFQIASGTGRFASATGTITFAETLVPALAGTPDIPAFYAITGDLTGSISGVAMDQGPQNSQR